MDQDSNKKPADGGPSSNAILLLVTLLAGALLVRQLPLSDSRPATAEPKPYPYASAQDIDARLWEDPIGAVVRGIKEELQQRPFERPDNERGKHSAASLRRIVEQLGDETQQPPIFVGVMVPGGTYSGYAEWRRKARYAVLSGLKEMGFTPDDPEHLGYFKFDSETLVGLSEGPVVKRAPAAQFIAYELLGATAASSQRTLGAVPSNSQAAGGDRNLVLLWLDQGIFWDKTVDKVDHLFTYLSATAPQAATPSEHSPKSVLPKPRVIILGPGDSSILAQMARNADAPGPALSSAIDLQFYDYAATAPDAYLLPAQIGHEAVLSLHDFFAQRNLTVFQTIGDDKGLACALRDELTLRGIGAPLTVSAPEPPLSPEVVLIAEWDTGYGKNLSDITRQVLTRGTKCHPLGKGPDEEATPDASAWSGKHWLKTYGYLRGLDGRLPASQSESGAGGRTSGAVNDDKAPSTASAGNDKRIERAEGQGQLDYLRRLAVRLHTLDEDARKHHRGGIRAIGILGSDVYDKLIVLQALRPAFPGAIFFTTDLDARLLHPTELDWTRNLIVASSFGLDLAPKLQSDIPPFRDAYQTSLYLSTLIALTNALNVRCRAEPGTGTADCPVDQTRIDAWRAQPRLFEIGRHGPFEFSASAYRERSKVADMDGTRSGKECDAVDELNCTVHPRARGLFPHLDSRAVRFSLAAAVLGLIALALALGAGQWIQYWALGTAPSPDAKMPPNKKAQLAGAGVCGLALLVFLVWVLPGFLERLFNFLTQDGDGVPMSLLDGVSAWPTELIRMLALGLAVWLICRGWQKLGDNLNEMSMQMHWQSEREALEAELEQIYKRWTPWQRFLHMFSFRLDWEEPTGCSPDGDSLDTSEALPPADPNTGLRAEAEAFWRKYIYQGRIKARRVRIVTAIVLYAVFASAVVAIFPFPINAIRGNLAKWLDVTLVVAAIVTMNFLIFFVVDATVLCRQFVVAIAGLKSKPAKRSADDFDALALTTRWPSLTLRHFANKLKIDERYVDQWVTIQVIGLRTKAVSRLIFYPYIVISLIIIARSSLFDNWVMPIALIIILGVSVLIVTVSAILLRSAAESARRRAVWRLSNELIRLNNESGLDRNVATQVEIMIAQIRRYDTGSFASYLEQPVLRAILLPLGSVGGISLLQYLTIWNF